MFQAPALDHKGNRVPQHIDSKRTPDRFCHAWSDYKGQNHEAHTQFMSFFQPAEFQVGGNSAQYKVLSKFNLTIDIKTTNTNTLFTNTLWDRRGL